MFLMKKLPRRLGAGSYLLYMSTAILAWSLLAIWLCEVLVPDGYVSFSQANYILSFVAGCVGTLYFLLSSMRLQDLNFQRWIAKIMSIPLTAAIILPLLCFYSSPHYENDYGLPPVRSGLLKRLLAVIAFGLALIFSWAAINSYLAMKYSQPFQLSEQEDKQCTG